MLKILQAEFNALYCTTYKDSAQTEGSQFGAQMGELEVSLEPSDTGGEGFRSLWPAALGPLGRWAPLEISQLTPLVLNPCTTPHERMT